jgi:hypothetical protein
MRDILSRDINVWGLPCLLDLSKDYWNTVLTSKERNMIRKARLATIQVETIEYDDYLDDIYEINTSSLIRQGRPMKSTYLAYPKPSTENNTVCDKHWSQYIGAFLDSKLIAYVGLLCHKDVVLISQILGHAKYLKTGVMNLVLYHAVEYSTAYKVKFGFPKIAMYDFWRSGLDGLRRFKKSMGFVPCSPFFPSCSQQKTQPQEAH